MLCPRCGEKEINLFLSKCPNCGYPDAPKDDEEVE